MNEPEKILGDESDFWGDEFNGDEEDYFENEYDENGIIDTHDEDEDPYEDYEFADESLNDIDFSELRGDFKSSLKKLDGHLKNRKPAIRKIKVSKGKKFKPRKPLSKDFGVKKRATIVGNGKKTTERIMVPRDREVIVQGVDRFMLNKTGCADVHKNIGYYKCKKLKELVFIFNNNSALDFNLELFNPSMPLDYLYSTSGNINNKIQVAGGTGASYTDVLYNLLANPTIIVNARLVVSGPSITEQQSVSFQVKNKNIAGVQKIDPLNLPQELDTLQFQSTVLNFDIMGQLNRPLFPNGMDVAGYNIKAGNTVTFCFYYAQKSLIKHFWKEAKQAKGLL